jgi:SAM-dependent methyltransferase
MNASKLEAFCGQALRSVYSEPEAGNFHTPLIPQLVQQVFVPMAYAKDARILDIGCGQGTFLDAVRGLGFTNLVGVTLSPEDVEACQAKGHYVRQEEMADLSAPDESVDFVWARHALEHSPFPLFALYELNRVLKPGGRLYVEVPAPGCARRHEATPNHYSILGEAMWIELLRKAGFTPMTSAALEFDLQHATKPVTERYLCFTATKAKALFTTV